MNNSDGYCVTCDGVTEEFPTPAAWLARQDELVRRWKGAVTYHRRYGNAVHWIENSKSPSQPMLQPLKTILFFDTETTGFCTSGPLDTQPYIVQIGWILAEFNGVDCFEKNRGDYLFKPKIAIPTKATEVHGKTDEMVADKPLFGTYVTEFVKLVKEADYVCGHNVKYDLDVLFHEIDRVSPESEKKSAWKSDSRKKAVDTMLIGTDVCKIPKWRSYKWPTLVELHTHLFGEAFDKAHDAMGDITATMRCFVELNTLGHVKLPE